MGRARCLVWLCVVFLVSKVAVSGSAQQKPPVDSPTTSQTQSPPTDQATPPNSPVSTPPQHPAIHQESSQKPLSDSSLSTTNQAQNPSPTAGQATQQQQASNSSFDSKNAHQKDPQQEGRIVFPQPASELREIVHMNPDFVEMTVRLNTEKDNLAFLPRATIAVEADFFMSGLVSLFIAGHVHRFIELYGTATAYITDLSFANQLRKSFNKNLPESLAMLAGMGSRFTLGRSGKGAFFIDTELNMGYNRSKTATEASQNSFLILPGIFGGASIVLNTGLTAWAKLGVSFPFDIPKSAATPGNAVYNTLPGLVLGVGGAWPL